MTGDTINKQKINKKLNIEIAYASETKQYLICYKADSGDTALEIIKKSKILEIAEIKTNINKLKIGIWSKLITLNTIINSDIYSDNTRIEIYRPLKCDPKESRKKRVKKE